MRGGTIESGRWYLKAIEGGAVEAEESIVAYRTIGGMYAALTPTENNRAEAMKWLRKAAEKGDAHSQYHLGFLYTRKLDGAKKNQNEIEAEKWLRKAAAQDNKPAQELLTLLTELEAERISNSNNSPAAHIIISMNLTELKQLTVTDVNTGGHIAVGTGSFYIYRASSGSVRVTASFTNNKTCSASIPVQFGYSYAVVFDSSCNVTNGVAPHPLR